VFRIAGNKICSAAKQKKHFLCCHGKVLILITVLTVTYVLEGKAFLLVLDNNDYEETKQIYVARVLITFATNKSVCPMYI
jgi:hypothetical protein